MSKATSKEIFSVNGKITASPTGRGREFTADSEPYLADCLNKLPIGKKVACTFSEENASRSAQQLSYHWVLMKYLSDYTGNTKEEMHDAIMRIVFGTKVIELKNFKVHVRKSIADSARFPKHKMVELTNYDLELCRHFDINVPTAKELGYVTEQDAQEKVEGVIDYPVNDGMPTI
jgi:hypothetical protein